MSRSIREGLKRQICRLGILSLFCSCVWAVPQEVQAQSVGYQEYYVLGYEEQVWRAFVQMYASANPPPYNLVAGNICSTVSLVATANYQVVYYDHWEDGYENDLLRPVQSTTTIYGDGDVGTGGTGDDILRAGDDLTLTSTRGMGGPNDHNAFVSVSPARNPSHIRYDGGDRIMTSGGPVSLAHAMWVFSNTWIGGAWEVPSRQTYDGTFAYQIPIGQDLFDLGGGIGGTYGDFGRVYLQLLAYEDNTTISIDNGSTVVNLTLDRGQTYSSMGYINSEPRPGIVINAGTTIRSNKPTQVGLVTGTDGAFQSRFLVVFPDKLLGADYVVPVPSGNPGNEAEVYLFNPNDYPITVQAYDLYTQTTFTIDALITSTVAYSSARGGYVPAGSAARFTSSDGVFGVVVCADTSGTDYDWGFTGIPAQYLTKDYYISWAPGGGRIPPTENGSPVWVTPLADGTTFYVDFGPLDGVVDQIFTLDALEQRRIFDPDNDNTGMHVWATDVFAAVWGQDARTSLSGDPYLDMGLTSLPLRERWHDPVMALDKSADPTVLPPEGGVVTFTLVTRAYDVTVADVDITDTLPISWTYIPQSTLITYPEGSGGPPDPDPVINGRSLFWDTSVDLAPNTSLTLTFQAQITTMGSISPTIYDGLESLDYSGGQNWRGDWLEGGEGDGPALGGVVISTGNPFDGSAHLAITAINRSLSRTADLSGFTRPTLRFARQVTASLSTEFYLDIFDGSAWTRVLTWTEGSQEGSYVQQTLDLKPYADWFTAVRFASGSSVGARDYLYIDQVEIVDAVSVNVNRGEAVGRLAYSNALFNPTDEATVYISPLDLVKSVSQSQANIGDTLVYTVAYANTSSSNTVTNVILHDIVPVQLTKFLSASGGKVYDGANGVITWSVGTLSPSASGIVTFAVQVAPFAQDHTIIGNVAYVRSDQSALAGSNVVRTRVLASDVRLEKSGPTVSRQGQVITYTLGYENVGKADATGVSIRDIVPVSTTYQIGSLAILTGTEWVTLSEAVDGDRGALVGSTLVITPGVTPGMITVGESGQIRFSVRISDGGPSNSLILNWATLYRDLDNPRDSNLVITRISDLAIEKSAEQVVAVPGGLVSYTLTYENMSQTISQTEVYVRETIPDYTAFVPGSAYGNNGEQVSYSWDNGETYVTTLPVTPVTHLRWYAPQVGPKAKGTVGFTVRVKDPLPSGVTIKNMGHISSTQVAASIRQWIPSNQIELGVVDLWIKTDASRSVAQPGDTISYTITYGNDGTVNETGAITSDVIPDSTVLVPGSISGGGIASGGTITWSVGLPAKSVGSVLGFAVTVSDLLASGVDVITNVVHISSETYGIVVSDVVTTAVEAEPDLAITKVGEPDIAAKGHNITYTIAISNVGNQGAAGVVVTDVLPNDTGLVYASDGGAELTGRVIWPAFELEAGEMVTRTLVVLVQESLPLDQRFLTNVVTVTDDGTNGADPFILNNVYTHTTVVNDAPELTIVKDDGVSFVSPGDVITFVLTVHNRGYRNATGVVVTDWLPANIALGPVSDGGSETFAGSGVVTWPPFALSPGATVSRSLAVTLNDPLPDGVVALTNTARVVDDGTNGEDLFPENNVYTHTTVIDAAPDLVVTKIGKPPSFPPMLLAGQVLTYTISVLNMGNQDATRVVLTDTLPDHTLFSYASHNGVRTGGFVTWSIDQLDVGQAVSRTLVVTLSQSFPYGLEAITNVVRAFDLINGPDPTPGNNVYTYTTLIGYAPALRLVKSGSITAAVGESALFTFTVSHDLELGDGTPISNVIVTDDIAGWATYVAGDDGNNLLDRYESWIYVASYRIRYTDPTPLTNTGIVSGWSVAGDVFTATATHSTVIAYDPALGIIKEGPAVARVKDTVVFTFTVSNIALVPTWVSQVDIGDGSPIRNLSVTDDVAGIASYVRGDDGDDLLEIGEAWIFTATYTILTVIPNPLVNVATAVGFDGNGDLVTGSDSHSTHITWLEYRFPIFFGGH